MPEQQSGNSVPPENGVPAVRYVGDEETPAPADNPPTSPENNRVRVINTPAADNTVRVNRPSFRVRARRLWNRFRNNLPARNGSNFTILLLIILIALVLFALLRPNTSDVPVAPPDDPSGEIEQENENEVVECRVALDDGAVTIQVIGDGQDQFLRQSPSNNARTVRGLVPTTLDPLAVLETECDESTGQLWARVEIPTTSEREVGWIVIDTGEDRWFEYARPSVATTEEPEDFSDSEGSSSQTLPHVTHNTELSVGSCPAPTLRPSEFANADELKYVNGSDDGVDVAPDWSGYWIRSSQYRADEALWVRKSPGYGGERFAKIPVRGPLEVAVQDGEFQYACAEGRPWWLTRFHDLSTGEITDVWVMEGDGVGLFVEGYKIIDEESD